MTPNKTEQLNSDNAQAAELVAWLRRLRLAEKASYAEIIRRINKRQAHSSPARSTISTTLSGKTNPRWETVEAIAWALGRDGAVAECQRRWELAYGHTLAPDNTPADVQPKWLGTRLDRPDSFQPRPDEHADLVAARASGRTAIVSGFHGTGKSQLAAAYAEELLPLDKSTGTFADGRSVDLIVWVWPTTDPAP